MFSKISPDDFSMYPFKKIGSDWMLITVSKPDGSFNTMTASWGGVGVLWGKNVCFCFIRKSRYTNEFAKSGKMFTLSFFNESMRSTLKFCGTRSGRNTDKVSECNLVPVHHESGAVYFDNATDVIVGEKIYADEIKKSCFIDKSCLKNYTDNDFHDMYVIEIKEILSKKY